MKGKDPLREEGPVWAHGPRAKKSVRQRASQISPGLLAMAGRGDGTQQLVLTLSQPQDPVFEEAQLN